LGERRGGGGELHVVREESLLFVSMMSCFSRMIDFNHSPVVTFFRLPCRISTNVAPRQARLTRATRGSCAGLEKPSAAITVAVCAKFEVFAVAACSARSRRCAQDAVRAARFALAPGHSGSTRKEASRARRRAGCLVADQCFAIATCRAADAVGTQFTIGETLRAFATGIEEAGGARIEAGLFVRRQ